MRPETVFRRLLWCYPAAFRHEYGREMQLMFRDELADARRVGSWYAQGALWLRTMRDLLKIAPKEHTHVLLQDIRYALRVE